MIYNEELLNACDKVSQRCASICGTHHGSAWLYNKLMRFFEDNPAATSITIPVTINYPMGSGEATIGRDGSLIMRRV